MKALYTVEDAATGKRAEIETRNFGTYVGPIWDGNANGPFPRWKEAWPRNPDGSLALIVGHYYTVGPEGREQHGIGRVVKLISEPQLKRLAGTSVAPAPAKQIKQPIHAQRFEAIRQITPDSATVLDDLIANRTSTSNIGSRAGGKIRPSWLKLIGSAERPITACPFYGNYNARHVGFRKATKPGIRTGDHLFLYAPGGSRRIFALAEAIGDPKRDRNYNPKKKESCRWKLRVRYLINLPVDSGSRIDDIRSGHRDLRESLRRASHIKLLPEEIRLVHRKLRSKQKQFQKKSLGHAEQITQLTLSRGPVPPDAKIVASPENNQLDYKVQTKAKIIRAKRFEAALLQRYHRWLFQQGRKISAIKYRKLQCDAYEAERRNLIEAKSSASREHVRMAVGQILDYAFQGKKKFGYSHKAILLPRKPNPDLVEWLDSLKIKVIWREGKVFLDNANGQFT